MYGTRGNLFVALAESARLDESLHSLEVYSVYSTERQASRGSIRLERWMEADVMKDTGDMGKAELQARQSSA